MDLTVRRFLPFHLFHNHQQQVVFLSRTTAPRVPVHRQAERLKIWRGDDNICYIQGELWNVTADLQIKRPEILERRHIRPMEDAVLTHMFPRLTIFISSLIYATVESEVQKARNFVKLGNRTGHVRNGVRGTKAAQTLSKTFI